MRVLITGGSGLLGQYLNEIISKNYDILTIYKTEAGNCKNFNSQSVDITNFQALEALFKSFQPEIVIHTAAISNPKLADEIRNKIVYKTNVSATGYMAKLCEIYNCKLIYTSTDLVYDGERGGLLTENSKLNPISLYAETKLMGEEKIKESTENYVILRVALMYGFGLNHSINHFGEVYNNLKSGKKVNLFYDQFRSPLALHDAARMINELIPLEIKGETINFGGNERLSRFDLISILCNIAGLDKSLLNRISMNNINFNYKVKDVSMNIAKLKSFGIQPASVEKSIQEILSGQFR